MALSHQAFMLDATNAKRKLIPLHEALQSGTAKPLFDEALQIVVRSNPDSWILDQTGCHLFDIRVENFVGVPYKKPIELLLAQVSELESCNLGYWFLLVLSSFLVNMNGIGQNYEILEWCLDEIGWAKDDIRLLFEGTPISTLFDLNADKAPRTLALSDPYWFWIRPAYSTGRTGWLSKSQIDHLHTKLINAEKVLYGLPPNIFGDRWKGKMPITTSEGQIDYLQRLRRAYKNSVTMLEDAKINYRELYMVISNE